MKTSSGAHEDYILPLTIREPEMVHHLTKPSAAGPSGIHYQMQTHLHPSTLVLILYLFDRIWHEGRFPSACKVATAIPLLKPGKDPSSASSYRPIALTSCLSKTFQRIVNKILMHYLEKENILDKNQCGFFSCRSTIDHLVRLETIIRVTSVTTQLCE